MKNKYFLLLFALASVQILTAQKQANHWYFGVFAGIDFTNGAPVAVSDGALNTNEGVTTMSDPNGNLLFYTEGINVYNREHKLMPNGTGLMGDISSTQSALAVQKPGDPNIYYLFTQEELGDPNGFRYSIISMPLDSGRGDVTVKNIPIRTYVTEKLSGVGMRNGNGYWIMIHDWGTNAFRAYKLTSAGFDTTAVVSNAGTPHIDTSFQTTQGQLKFSPDGTKVAVAVGSMGIVEWFDFNDSTGVVSNPRTLSTPAKVYGLEFSPNSSKLYATHYTIGQSYNLVQYNLALGIDTLIAQSRTLISNQDEMRQLQLGPDGKIYVAMGFGSGALSVIDSPDLAGVACTYRHEGLPLGAQCGLGLPNYITSFFVPGPGKPEANFTISQATICPGTCIDFNDASVNNATTWKWHFPGAIPDSSTKQNPQDICFPQSGIHAVTFIVSNADGVDTLTVHNAVSVRQNPPVIVTLKGDTLTAFNAIMYQWYLNGNLLPGDTFPELVAQQPGNYTVQVTDSFGCIALSEPFLITGIKDLLLGNSLRVFPVPATDVLNIELPVDWNASTQVTLHNVLGEIVKDINTGWNRNTARINVENLPSGFYILKYKLQSYTLSTPFIKQ